MAKAGIVCSGSDRSNINPTLIFASSLAALGNEVVIYFNPPGAAVMLKGELEKIKGPGVPDLAELYDGIIALGARIIVCELALDVKGYKQEDFREGLEIGGSTTFLAAIQDATLTFCF